MADNGVPLPRWTSKFTLSAQKPGLAPLQLGENEHAGPMNPGAGAAAGALVRGCKQPPAADGTW